MVKKLGKVFAAGILSLGVSILYSPAANAVGVAYFTLPLDFADNVTATIVAIAGTLLGLLGLMFAWRKTVKSTNRS